MIPKPVPDNTPEPEPGQAEAADVAIDNRSFDGPPTDPQQQPEPKRP